MQITVLVFIPYIFIIRIIIVLLRCSSILVVDLKNTFLQKYGGVFTVIPKSEVFFLLTVRFNGYR
jgi:hypothetical protein